MVISNIFENVNNWLKFAEVKNGTIIALNSALIFGLFQTLQKIEIDNIALTIYIYSALASLFVSIIIAILSFVPKLSHQYISFDKPKNSDNLLYFGDIAKYTEEQYIYKLSSKINEITNLDKEYINQIVVNSKITYIKYKQFELAVWFNISAFITPLGVIILYKFRN
jgi:hypothetical protein